MIAPTTGVDAPTQIALLWLIRGLHRERHLTVLFVTHDINAISPVVVRLAVLVCPKRQPLAES